MTRPAKGERIRVTIALDKEAYEVVAPLAQKVGQDFSGLVDLYIQGLATVIKKTGLEKKPHFSKLDLFRIAIAGFPLNP